MDDPLFKLGVIILVTILSWALLYVIMSLVVNLGSLIFSIF